MIRIEDIYVVDAMQTQVDIPTLILLYQPLIGKEAISFYLCCLSDVRNTAIKSHRRLSNLLNIGINELEKARQLCEEFGLIRTFLKEEKDQEFYIYQCQLPLDSVQFFNNDVYSRLLLKALGTEDYHSTQFLFSKTKQKIEGAKEITTKLQLQRIQGWNSTQEMEYSKIQPRMNFNPEISVDQFDFQKFLRFVTPLTFPIEARTEENLRLIGEYARLYGISEERMRVIIGRCTNNPGSKLNIDYFKKLCALEKPKEETQQDMYKMSPVSFLQQKQNGIPVTPVDKDLLAYLALELRMEPEVINLLIEYILKINENKLSKRYVQSIAGQWLRADVKTKEDALKMIQKPAYSPVRAKSTLPDYMKEHPQIEKREITEEERTKLLKLFEEVGE